MRACVQDIRDKLPLAEFAHCGDLIKNRSVGVIMSKQDLLPRDRAESDPGGNTVFWGGFPTCLETKVVGECTV